jgi:hypothetical protein
MKCDITSSGAGVQEFDPCFRKTERADLAYDVVKADSTGNMNFTEQPVGPSAQTRGFGSSLFDPKITDC